MVLSHLVIFFALSQRVAITYVRPSLVTHRDSLRSVVVHRVGLCEAKNDRTDLQNPSAQGPIMVRSL